MLFLLKRIVTYLEGENAHLGHCLLADRTSLDDLLDVDAAAISNREYERHSLFFTSNYLQLLSIWQIYFKIA